ncbi:uncharacterized protein si:dkey-103g5.4 isoform X2 [Polyodon spathula]|uniref:uncharacterized protein si:dkey-103g5.4 isoform X2 n=1 Tax=Polyodon spathula TaxID=7913 RepID=UPI001B7DA3EB|nr:uncharacterized protein si:dkey-103g5.4 isoform X2 [Polyodon spathula]
MKPAPAWSCLLFLLCGKSCTSSSLSSDSRQGSCGAGTTCTGEGSNHSRCQAGFYCPEGSAVPVPCPKGSFGPTEAALSANDCLRCPVDFFNHLEGQAACFTCGSEARQPQEGQESCLCLGEGQEFQVSDSQCPCLSGYRPAGQGSRLCVQQVYEICRDGSTRNQEGACLTQEQWKEYCALQGYDKALGLCLCGFEDVDTVCNRECRRRQRHIIQLLCRETFQLQISDNGNKVKASVNTIETFTSSWDSIRMQRCAPKKDYAVPVYLVQTKALGFLGVLNPDPKEIQNLFWTSRKAKSHPNITSKSSGNAPHYNKTAGGNDTLGGADKHSTAHPDFQFAGILNPTACLSVGDVLVFIVSKEHYPVYDVGNLLNTNSKFDWGGFRALAEEMSLSQAASKLFSFPFTQPGVYVLKLNSNQHKKMSLRVMPVGGQCYEEGPFFPTIPRHVIQIGIARSRTASLLLRPDWPVIVGLLIGALVIFSVCVTLLILFREFGWPEKKPADPKYRKLHLKYNFDDYSSKGSTVLALKKLHRRLQRQECEEELGTGAPQVDEFWDYEQQIDLEAFDTNLFYGILLKHTVSVTTKLSQLKDEVKVLYQKTLRETESLKELLVSWTNLSGKGKLVGTAVLESFETKCREVEAEVGRRKALAVEFGRLQEKQLQLLAEDWRSREEHHVSFSAALLEAQRLLEQLCELEGRACLPEEEGSASLLTQRLASLLAQMSEEVTRECQRLGAWGVLGDGTGAHLLSRSKAEILTREDLLAPDGTVRACDVVHIDPLTGLIVPNADAQMLSASGSPVPVPRDLCVNPHTGKLLPVAGNVAFDPRRSTLVFTADCRAGELSKWEEPPIPFVPFPVCSRTGLPVKCTLGGLNPGRDLKLGGPMADPATGVPVPTLGVTIHPHTGRVHPLGGTYVSPLTKLLESIEIGGVMVHHHTGHVLPIIGVSLDPHSGCVIPVGGVLSPSGAPLLMGDTFTEPLSGKAARISGASLKGAQVVPHGGGYQASLDALTLACRVRVTACLNQCRASLQEHSLLKESTGELAKAWRRSQLCLIHTACELERQRERTRSLADSGGSWGLMKYPGTQLLLPAVAGVGYPDPGGSGMEVPLLGVQGDGSRGELIPLAGTMEDPDGKGLVPISIGARAVDPVTGEIAPVVGARFDPCRNTVVPKTQTCSRSLRGKTSLQVVDLLEREMKLRDEYWKDQRQKEEELLRGLTDLLQNYCSTNARGGKEKARWKDHITVLRGLCVCVCVLQARWKDHITVLRGLCVGLQGASLAETQRRAFQASDLSFAMPSQVIYIMTKVDREEGEQHTRFAAVFGEMLEKVSQASDKMKQEEDRLRAQAQQSRIQPGEQGVNLKYRKVHSRLLKDSWETLLRRQAGVDVALCRLLYLRELSYLHAVTGKTLLSGSSYWSGDYQMIRHQPTENPQRASEAKQRELIPLLEQLLPLLQENRVLHLSPGTPRPASGEEPWESMQMSCFQDCVVGHSSTRSHRLISERTALETSSRAWTTSVPADKGRSAVFLRDSSEGASEFHRSVEIQTQALDEMPAAETQLIPTTREAATPKETLPTSATVDKHGKARPSDRKNPHKWQRLLQRSPLFQLLKELDGGLRASAQAAGLILPEEEGKTRAAADRPFLELLDAQWVCEGELTPLNIQSLTAREITVYQHGQSLLRSLQTHIHAPVVTLLLATSLPSNNYTSNAFRHSFFYQEAQKILFIRRQRLQSVGGFTLLLLHCVSHIAAGGMTSDSCPVFLRLFYQALEASFSELYSSCSHSPVLTDILQQGEPCSEGAQSALAGLLQGPTSRAFPQQKYNEAAVYSKIESLVKSKMVEMKREYFTQPSRRSGPRNDVDRGPQRRCGRGEAGLPLSADEIQEKVDRLNEEMSELLGCEYRGKRKGSLPEAAATQPCPPPCRESLLRHIEELERECGLSRGCENNPSG